MPEVVPFFVSSGRSGLTLLRMIFDSHPDFAVAHEPRFLSVVVKRADAYQTGSGFDVDRFLTDIYAVGNFRRLGLDRAAVAEELERQRPQDLAEACRVVFAMYASSRGKTRYGDKTPLYISFIDEITALFPEARFVHLVRDGRDAVLAYLERDKGPASVAEGAFHWRLRVMRGRRGGERVGPSRYREFRYEDLVEKTETTVRAVCEHLGVEFHPEMLDYQATSQRFLAEAKNPGDHQHLTLAPTKGLIDWRTAMSVDDLATFEAIAGDALEAFGYELGSERRRSRLYVGWEWLRWQTRRVWWRLLSKTGRTGRPVDD